MRPDTFEGEYPLDCEGDEFDVAQLQSILPLLEQVWPSVLEDNSNEQIWQVRAGICGNI